MQMYAHNPYSTLAYRLNKKLVFTTNTIYHYGIVQSNYRKYGYGLLKMPTMHGYAYFTILVDNGTATVQSCSNTDLYTITRQNKYYFNMSIKRKHTLSIREISQVINTILSHGTEELKLHAYINYNLLCSECNAMRKYCVCYDNWCCYSFNRYRDSAIDYTDIDLHMELHRETYGYCTHCDNCDTHCIGYHTDEL